MGLKYHFFIAQGDPDQLLKDLVKIGAVDETALMLEEQKFSKEQLDDMAELGKAQTISREDKVNKFDKILSRKRRPELELYFKNQSESMAEFSIWWMKAPFAPGWLVGGFTSYFMHHHTCGAIAAQQLHNALNIVYHIHYHHGSNEGIVIKSVKGGHPVGENLEPLKEETERFEIYIARISKEHNIPVDKLHAWIESDSTPDPIQWTHEVTWKPKKAI